MEIYFLILQSDEKSHALWGFREDSMKKVFVFVLEPGRNIFFNEINMNQYGLEGRGGIQPLVVEPLKTLFVCVFRLRGEKI